MDDGSRLLEGYACSFSAGNDYSHNTKRREQTVQERNSTNSLTWFKKKMLEFVNNSVAFFFLCVYKVNILYKHPNIARHCVCPKLATHTPRESQAKGKSKRMCVHVKVI